MDLIGGKDSIAPTSDGQKYILTIIAMFTKYFLAVLIADQSREAVVEKV